MKILKTTSKQGARLSEAYNNSKLHSIQECYVNPSRNKINAEADCIRMMISESGYGYKILSYNTMQFTCGWQCNDGIRVETRCNSYLITDLPF